MHFETAAIHAGQSPDQATGSAVVPIYQTSTYVQDAVGVHKGFEYSRTDNPTRKALEDCLAALEGASAGLAFGSGMAAIATLALTLESGARVLIPDDVYGGTYRLFAKVLADFGVHFDVMSSEQAIYDAGRVNRAIDLLAERGLTYESEGALWLRTTQFGDDKDRVLRKGDGSLTYLVPDIAYHIDKHDRGFDRAIDVWGADHHGYIPRMRAVLLALGYPPDFFGVELVQLVKVMREGEEVKMSKRSGEFVTLRDLFEEVGVDAARYFFLARKGASPLDFDVELAKKQTDENPVFYVQMAHARLSGIFRTAGRDPDSVTGELDLAALPAPQDTELLKKLVTFPDIVTRAAREREPHRITVFLHELATMVHGWYHHTRAVGAPEGPETERARLLLARAARIVLANALTLLGISAPDRM
jgi:arginyl-tRNA synthetase